jgi:nucleotidyltransferase/DNA polymerase involved in DNA repair
METEVYRKIIHVDMDAMLLVEQMDNPELKGKPLPLAGSEIAV